MNRISIDSRTVAGKLKDYLPLEIIIVNKTELEPLWDYMVRNYHYLSYEKMIGPRIKYLVRYKGTPIAALSYNRASFKVAVRDAYIGWNPQQKKFCLKHVVNNNRFLILPWVKVKNLASYLLSRTLKMLQSDWLKHFGVEPHLVETFVDAGKYRGTCYRAANWLYLGETSGFSKVGDTFVYHGQRKDVYIYALDQKKLSRLIKSAPCHRTLNLKRERVLNMMLHTPDWSPQILEQAGITADEVLKLGDLLDEYLAIYQDCYYRSDQRKHGETFVKGLLSDVERKSIEPIALEYDGPKGVRTLQIFFKDSPIDDELMLKIYQQRLASAIAHPQGMINTDASDFVKKGKYSVGVYRQYCGALGKVENCQSGVFVGYSSERGYGLINRILYMPEAWFDDDHADLRDDCKVPAKLQFKTKVELALEMITQAAASGLFPARWIGCDSFFGRNKDFLATLPEEYYYFADIPENYWYGLRCQLFPCLSTVVAAASRKTQKRRANRSRYLKLLRIKVFPGEK
ncbi:MAG: transposase [Bacillota bacterium]